MIEIVPDSNSFTGSYSVPIAVDTMTYLYVYNEVFVEEWNQYITEINAGPFFIKSKWLRDDSDTPNDVDINTLSMEEKIEMATDFSNAMEARRGKKRRFYEKLVDNFDRTRNLITFYKTKFYAYEISHFADHVSVFQIEKNEISDILNDLYLRIKKKKRIITREELLREFQIYDED